MGRRRLCRGHGSVDEQGRSPNLHLAGRRSPSCREQMPDPTAASTFAWADWSARYCLPLLLEQLGEAEFAESARSIKPIVDGGSSDEAFSVLRGISDRVCDQFGRGTC